MFDASPDWLPPLVTEFLFSYSTLFAIINPFGLAFIFLARTEALAASERHVVAKKIAIYAFGVLVVSLYLGTVILKFFGVSLPALRVAGGLVVAASGWQLLNSPPHTDDGSTEARQSFASVIHLTFFPLTVPLTTGPGTIATAIALGAHREEGLRNFLFSSILSTLVAGAIAWTIFYAYSRSAVLAKLLGVEGTRVVMRLSAFLLLCVGVQIIMTGLTDYVRPNILP